jgi:hypothetical protein
VRLLVLFSWVLLLARVSLHRVSLFAKRRLTEAFP